MFLCEMFSRVKFDDEGLNMAWFLLHMFGLFANCYACSSLKRNWTRLGNFKILLATSVFANISALVVHLYLPVNHMLGRTTGLQWNFGSGLCSILPPVSNLALCASILSFSGIIIEQYYKRLSHEEMSVKAMENTVVMIWVCAAFITAPQFCQCGSVTISSTGAGVCIHTWQRPNQGMLYDSIRLVLQYAFPIGLTACSFFKDQILQMSSTEKPTRVVKFACGVVNVAAAVFVGAVIFVYPVQLMQLQKRDVFLGYGNGAAVPDVSGALRCMEFLAILCCVAMPFEIEALIRDEINTECAYYKRIDQDDDDELLDDISNLQFDEVKICEKDAVAREEKLIIA